MKEFQLISNLLTSAMPSCGDIPAAAHLQRKLAHRWCAQAGNIAAHSQPLLFTSGRLVIFVESAAWGNEIRHRAHSLCTALNHDDSADNSENDNGKDDKKDTKNDNGNDITINAIEVKILPNSPPADKPTRPPPRLSRQNGEQIAQLADTILHPQLKASLLRLAKRADKK